MRLILTSIYHNARRGAFSFLVRYTSSILRPALRMNRRGDVISAANLRKLYTLQRETVACSAAPPKCSLLRWKDKKT